MARRETPRKGSLPRVPAVDPLITLSEEGGVRYLHFGTEWVQGAMRVRRPWDLELDYSRHMMAWLLFLDPPARLLQLGLGAGSLTRYVHRHLPETATTVVDNSAAVLRVARANFRLPADDSRLEVIIEDGEAYVSHPGRRRAFQVLQVDVFDAQARGPALDSAAFYRGCRQVLDDDGILVVNLFGEVPSYGVNLANIKAAFDDNVLLLPPIEAGNVIVLAFADRPSPLVWADLYARAAELERRYKLDATGWVSGLKASWSRGFFRHLVPGGD
ncbi:MAG: spermidine synthase [Burkholderiaceae bacterium]